jgi:hypothetical protein
MPSPLVGTPAIQSPPSPTAAAHWGFLLDGLLQPLLPTAVDKSSSRTSPMKNTKQAIASAWSVAGQALV